MFQHSFESMGTSWHLSIDADEVPRSLIKDIEKKSDEFDQQYSRFIETSEANTFRNCVAGNYEVSVTLALLLKAGKKLQKLTDDAFDLSVATLFEKIGYDSEYNFQKAPEAVQWKPPQWSINGTTLTIDGPVVFDVGGIGKGYWIDQISEMVSSAGFTHHLVDGGGDMFGTTKRNGEAWRIALEYPGKPEEAIGMVELKNQGLAVSDVFKRKWKNWNHLVNAQTLQPIKNILASAAIAPSAFIADQMTSLLSFGKVDEYPVYENELNATYMATKPDQTLLISQNWTEELYL